MRESERRGRKVQLTLWKVPLANEEESATKETRTPTTGSYLTRPDAAVRQFLGTPKIRVEHDVGDAANSAVQDYLRSLSKRSTRIAEAIGKRRTNQSS
ncbi:hypothetical protein NUW54_g8851 [Trametes sanguinea]|uniref:Uncharacterized protein n=1 Tax=Trametes sanguinea TaxID=158606 RepID=A0ACC1PBA9_9APHY|nr:hypothetical protein NUW54_g8851 [Trametes sanguinea]